MTPDLGPAPGGAVDSHVHVIGDPARYPFQPVSLPGDSWYRGDAAVDAPAFAPLMREADVRRAVLVQPVGAYGDDNRYALDAAAADPERFAAVCMVDPRAPEPAARLRACVRDSGAAGVRLFAIRDPATEPLDGPVYEPLWAEAAALRLPVVITVWPHQLAPVAAVLDRYGVPVVVDHCGFPDFDALGRAALDPLLTLAAHPLVSVKVTTHVLHAGADGGQPPPELVARLVAELGAERVMWGSDFAQTHDRPYPQLVEVGREACTSLRPDQRAAVLGGNAERLWWAGGQAELARTISLAER